METNEQRSALSLGGWIGTLIVLAIPLVNLIMLFVWGFGAGDIGRKRYCQAMLILAAIGLVLWLIIGLITGFTMFSIFNNLY
jgi:hypothetical protein